MLGVGEAIAVSSGTDALLVAMMALGIGPGDEVVTSAFSFFATAGCVARLGARPVFVDIDPATFALDPRGVERAITPRTRAIVPVHLYGLAADMDPILERAAASGIPVIEDACQAIGATYRGRTLGSLGAVGCFSFYPSKTLGAFGDGGLVTTDEAALAAKIRLLRGHGAEQKYHHRTIGGNFRIDEIQAAVLRVKLPHLGGWIEARRRHAGRYDRLFAEAGLDMVVPPTVPADRTHVYHQYVVRVPRRDDLRAHLASCGVGTEIYYPVPFHLQACFADLGYRAGAFPEAERAAAETLALPVYAELTPDQQASVLDGIRAFFERGASER
jgi:dTDP-4-amino-4,6-dideoxygalactose transaminase